MKLFTLNNKENSKEFNFKKEILSSNQMHQIKGGDGTEADGGIVIR